MNLAMYVESLREQLIAAAEMGGVESKAVVERLSAGLEAATRLVLLETLSAAADEITTQFGPPPAKAWHRRHMSFVGFTTDCAAFRTSIDGSGAIRSLSPSLTTVRL